MSFSGQPNQQDAYHSSIPLLDNALVMCFCQGNSDHLLDFITDWMTFRYLANLTVIRVNREHGFPSEMRLGELLVNKLM